MGGTGGVAPTTCSSHGTCNVSTGTCNCKPGWNPPDCSTCQPQGWVIWPISFGQNWGTNPNGYQGIQDKCGQSPPKNFTDGYVIETNDTVLGSCYSSHISPTFAWIATTNYLQDFISPLSDPLANIVIRAANGPNSVTAWESAPQARVSFQQLFTNFPKNGPAMDQNWGTLMPIINDNDNVIYTGVGWQDVHGNCGDCQGWTSGSGLDHGCGTTPNTPYFNTSQDPNPDNAKNYNGCGGATGTGEVIALCMSLVLPPP